MLPGIVADVVEMEKKKKEKKYVRESAEEP
jgi:hypothetical protein